jgi:ribonuclease HI
MNYKLYTDGSARSNPNGPGGYGTILRGIENGEVVMEKVFSAGYKKTTNNRMELMGVIIGLEAITKPGDVEVISDSKYVSDAFNQKWINSWLKNGWTTSSKQPVKNIDLWQRLLKAKEPYNVTFTWVKGHATHPENNKCDKLATTAADNPDKNMLLDDIVGEVVL